MLDESVNPIVTFGIDVEVPVQLYITLKTVPDVELESWMQEPAVVVMLVATMSVPPSASVTVPLTVNEWLVAASVKLPTIAAVGAVLSMVMFAEKTQLE